MLLNDEQPTINGDGKQSRDFTYTAWSQLIIPFLIPSVITLLTSTSIYQYSFFWVAAGLYYCYFGRGRDGEKMRHFKIKFKK